MFLLISLITIFAMLAACTPAAAPAAEKPADKPAEKPAVEKPAAEKPAAEKPADKPADKPAEAGKFKACLLSPGPVNDQGWNQIAYDALKRMEKELGAEISFVELGEDPGAFEKAFRDYGTQGCNFILGHGNQFEDAAKAAAKDYPKSYFFISSSRIYEGNVIGLNTDSSQPMYLLGMIAAKMGKGAGLVGGMDIPPISESFTGFINGAKSVDPNFKVNTMYLGNWTDIAAAKEAALSFTKGGVDFLAPNANIAGNGIYQACAEANVSCFGTFGDSTAQAPKNIVANYLNNYGNGIIKMAKQVKEGSFKPTKNIEFGLSDEDVLWVTFNDKADKPVTAEVKKLLDDAKKKIVAGEINTLAPIK